MEIQTQGSAAEIYLKLKTRFQEYRAQGRLKQITSIEYFDDKNEAILKGTGFSSTLKCEDSKIVIDLNLNFLLMALRGQIEDGIRKKVMEVLA